MRFGSLDARWRAGGGRMRKSYLPEPGISKKGHDRALHSGTVAAEHGGFDEVMSRGALAPSLRSPVQHLSEGGGMRAYGICNAQDVAGRIGFLLEAAVPDLGKVSLFREQGRLVCLGTCPHQGAGLGRGEIEEGVVTCPAHGSRFAILTV